MSIGTNRHAVGMRDARPVAQGNPACGCPARGARVDQRFIADSNTTNVIVDHGGHRAHGNRTRGPRTRPIPYRHGIGSFDGRGNGSASPCFTRQIISAVTDADRPVPHDPTARLTTYGYGVVTGNITTGLVAQSDVVPA